MHIVLVQDDVAHGRISERSGLNVDVNTFMTVRSGALLYYSRRVMIREDQHSHAAHTAQRLRLMHIQKHKRKGVQENESHSKCKLSEICAVFQKRVCM